MLNLAQRAALCVSAGHMDNETYANPADQDPETMPCLVVNPTEFLSNGIWCYIKLAAQ
jgi:hypothetical protein